MNSACTSARLRDKILFTGARYHGPHLCRVDGDPADFRCLHRTDIALFDILPEGVNGVEEARSERAGTCSLFGSILRCELIYYQACQSRE